MSANTFAKKFEDDDEGFLAYCKANKMEILFFLDSARALSSLASAAAPLLKEAEVKPIRKKKPKSAEDEAKPKRASGYFTFAAEKREKAKPTKLSAKDIGGLWADLNPDEQQVYKDAAKAKNEENGLVAKGKAKPAKGKAKPAKPAKGKAEPAKGKATKEPESSSDSGSGSDGDEE